VLGFVIGTWRDWDDVATMAAAVDSAASGVPGEPVAHRARLGACGRARFAFGVTVASAAA
jgi:hypothetical protein